MTTVPCHSPAEVAETIRLARDTGQHLAPRGGGHCFAGRSTTDGIILDTRPMRTVSVAGDVATIGAGALLGDIYDALGDRTIPAGCGPMVGIAGLTLGGGLGILGRQYGLTCDSLLAAQVVLADGRIVDCAEDRHPDLFWALRGAGGGQFGVVTSFTFRTVAAPTLTAFHLRWPKAEAAKVIEAWTFASPNASDALAASLLVSANAKGTTVNLFGATQGPRSEVDALIGISPETATYERLSFRDTKRYLAAVGELWAEPGDSISKSEFFTDPLPADSVAELVDQLDRNPGQARELDFMPMGGAYNRMPVGATAFAHRDARFLVKHAAIDQGAARRWLDESWATVRPWGTGGVYPNFPDPYLTDWATAYHGVNLDRLRAVKAQYDPQGFFRFHQSIEESP